MDTWDEVFKLYDANNDSLIDQSELKAFLHTLGYKPTEEELSFMMSELGAEESGHIDQEGFMSLISKYQHEFEDKDLLERAFMVNVLFLSHLCKFYKNQLKLFNLIKLTTHCPCLIFITASVSLTTIKGHVIVILLQLVHGKYRVKNVATKLSWLENYDYNSYI